MQKQKNKFLIALCSLLIAHSLGVAHAASSPALLSKYGEIQNVQTYSSNPYWNPNSPYNQRMPQPVYVTGPELNAGDCISTVDALIASFCVLRNNCFGMMLKDVRPDIMIQLSRMPGHNWATACAGYIDVRYDEYHRVNDSRVTYSEFPDATTPVSDETTVTFQNPYAPPAAPDWAVQMRERGEKLKALQEQAAALEQSQ